MQSLKSLFAVLQKGLRTVLPTCRDVTRLQSEALDKALPAPQRAGLRLHLALCKWCRRYGTQIRFLRKMVRAHSDELTEAAPPTLSPAARERLKRALHDQSN